jgi:hypothetical protein
MKKFKILIKLILLFGISCNFHESNQEKMEKKLDAEIYKWKEGLYKQDIKSLPHIAHYDFKTWEKSIIAMSSINIIKNDFNKDGIIDCFLTRNKIGIGIDTSDFATYIYSQDNHYIVVDNFSNTIEKQISQYIKNNYDIGFDNILVSYFDVDEKVHGMFILSKNNTDFSEYLSFKFSYNLYLQSITNVDAL